MRVFTASRSSEILSSLTELLKLQGTDTWGAAGPVRLLLRGPPEDPNALPPLTSLSPDAAGGGGRSTSAMVVVGIAAVACFGAGLVVFWSLLPRW